MLYPAPETIGAALRTQDGCNVVYVSVGHRISLEAAVARILDLAPRYRLPEPQRQACMRRRKSGGSAPGGISLV